MPDDENFDAKATWARTKTALRARVGADTFQSWIAPLSLRGVDGGVVTLEAPSTFARNWVSANLESEILRAWRAEDARVLRIDLKVAARPASDLTQASSSQDTRPQDAGTPRTPSTTDGPTSTGGGDNGAWGAELPSSPLDPRFTFDQFVVGRPNELAHAAARRVAEAEAVPFNPLFLYSGVGLGKTHLMHAIAWHLQANRPDRRVLYLSAEQFMYRFVQALRFRNTMEFKHQFRSVDVLLIDDVQFIAGKDSTQEEFFHTFNALIDQNKQIVISADRSPGEIDGIEERIKSRLQWGLVVDIHPTNYELRLGILQSKADALLATHPVVDLCEKVLPYLAHRISSNVRVLEGALTRLVAFADLVGRRIDLDMTQECLADTLKQADRKVTMEVIKQKVCEHYNMRMTDLISARRARAVARPRQVAMYLAKQLTTRSLPEIGRAFGKRDHTTVLHAVRRIETLIETDSALAEDVEILRRMLEE
jgi:chromosomal replication initiator protein